MARDVISFPESLRILVSEDANGVNRRTSADCLASRFGLRLVTAPKAESFFCSQHAKGALADK